MYSGRHQGHHHGRGRKQRRDWNAGNVVFVVLLLVAGFVLLDIASLHEGTIILGGASNVGRVTLQDPRTTPDIRRSPAEVDIVRQEPLGPPEGSSNGGWSLDSGEEDAGPETSTERHPKSEGEHSTTADVKTTESTKRGAPPARTGSSKQAASRGSEKREDDRIKVDRLTARLSSTKVVLGKERTVTNSRLTCGGSHTVQWRSYRELRDSFIDKNKLYRHLPPKSVSLLDFAKAVDESPCFKSHRYNYKHNNCTFVPPAEEQGANQQAELCAVVGNGGRLRQEFHQDAIDSADIVIRFNQGVTQGFEKHVGTKSTIRMYNGPYISPKQPGEITIAQIREMAIRAWVKQAQKHEQEHLAFMFDPDFICHAWDWVDRKGEKPSSGLVGIILSLRLCKHTNVYGFQFDEYFNTSIRPHYYNWERPKPGRENVHPFAEEKRLYKMLEKEGRLTLF
ncbi:sialyltransferase [Chloropicon primus]|uniref:Sialyltransferase n=1 Tax=Chloropicon primus TaxID=1764295 RepID=A0A5B8MTB0_9CHLO|nr:sialyltransferase [Chloropicon primus]UPR02758.1 sialyltransferase [Chloropicon primus]|eukprot:QDZ23546.1 sialyltransferase [Chloropicon primus]